MASSKKLDRKRDFGTIHGDSDGRAFIQDGVMFDAAGNEFGAATGETDAERADREAAEAAAKEAAEKAAVDAAVVARLAALGLGPDGKPLPKADKAKG